MKNIMVTGGAGYIGSHAVKLLVESGYQVVVLDNLYRGHRSAVHDDAMFIQADLHDTDTIVQVLNEYKVEGVMHFAALAYVGESVTEPLKYYENNTGGTISLLQALNEAKVNRMVFSSTCATYGEPDRMPIVESMPQSPINPYGMSKLMVEYVLKDYANANPDFAYTALRYFNVAGCAADGSIGEDHDPETHLIPVVLEAASGKREAITIFGTDYDTPDGTCIRDYIHVEDLCSAHIAALESLSAGQQRFYNLGIGNGISVKEIIDAAKAVTGVDINVNIGERRAGDPPMLYANADKIRSELGWEPKYTDLNEIVQTAWNWFKNNPDGYSD